MFPIIIVSGPPNSVGVTKSPTAGMKVSRLPATIPGSDRGIVTFNSVQNLLAPRSHAASIRFLSSFSRFAYKGNVMNGMKPYVSPRTTENGVLIRVSGSVMMCKEVNMVIITPSERNIAIHPRNSPFVRNGIHDRWVFRLSLVDIPGPAVAQPGIVGGKLVDVCVSAVVLQERFLL